MLIERKYWTEPWERDEEDGDWSRHYCCRFLCIRLLPWMGFERCSYRYDGLRRTVIRMGWLLIAYGKDHGFEYSEDAP